MNKKLAVVLAALMMLSSTTFLANSISTNVTVDKAVTASGTEVTVTKETSVEATTKLEENKPAAVEKAEAVNADVVAMVPLTGTVPAGETVDVTVDVPSVETGKTYKVFHLKSDNTWETLDAEVPAAGKLTIKGISEFSPFYIAEVDTTATTAPVYNGAHFATQLPKTGVVAVLPVAAMACLAGAVVCGRKEK